jgi:tRNA dimethylallyltransferase
MKPLICITGQTASGKSRFAFELAHQLSGEILSVDAMKVFKGMDIGTTKPSKKEQEEVPYHLLDIQEPDHPFSMGAFVKAAEETMERLQSQGKWIILEGGTALYLKALLWGMIEGPPRSPLFRQGWEKRAEEEGNLVLYQRLQEVDPVSAQKLHWNDRKRLIRALEIFEQTGKALSQQQQQFHQSPRYPCVMYAFKWERSVLYERINQRTLEMVEKGWIEEVKALQEKECCEEAWKALGYRELLRYLQGEWSLEEAIAQIQQQTRKFAKRQGTWFNNGFPQLQWLEATLPFEYHLEKLLSSLSLSS